MRKLYQSDGNFLKIIVKMGHDKIIENFHSQKQSINANTLHITTLW